MRVHQPLLRARAQQARRARARTRGCRAPTPARRTHARARARASTRLLRVVPAARAHADARAARTLTLLLRAPTARARATAPLPRGHAHLRVARTLEDAHPRTCACCVCARDFARRAPARTRTRRTHARTRPPAHMWLLRVRAQLRASGARTHTRAPRAARTGVCGHRCVVLLWEPQLARRRRRRRHCKRCRRRRCAERGTIRNRHGWYTVFAHAASRARSTSPRFIHVWRGHFACTVYVIWLYTRVDTPLRVHSGRHVARFTIGHCSSMKSFLLLPPESLSYRWIHKWSRKRWLPLTLSHRCRLPHRLGVVSCPWHADAHTPHGQRRAGARALAHVARAHAHARPSRTHTRAPHTRS